MLGNKANKRHRLNVTSLIVSSLTATQRDLLIYVSAERLTPVGSVQYSQLFVPSPAKPLICPVQWPQGLQFVLQGAADSQDGPGRALSHGSMWAGASHWKYQAPAQSEHSRAESKSSRCATGSCMTDGIQAVPTALLQSG